MRVKKIVSISSIVAFSLRERNLCRKRLKFPNAVLRYVDR